MSKRPNQKLKLLYLMKIFTEQTDERRSLTLSQISEELLKYGIESRRKSLYDDIEALRVYGFNVCTKRDRYVRYYLRGKRFDSAEIKLLSDFIANNDLLTNTKKEEFIKKFVGLASFEDGYFDEMPIERDGNGSTYKKIEIICKAIATDKCITFKRFEWNSYKQRILVNGGEVFAVSPWRLLLTDNGYRLIAFDNLKKEIHVFDPGRLLDVSISSKKRDGEKAFLSFSFSECESDNVRLFCDNSVAGEIIDRFGLDVTVLANREDHFEISVKTDVNASFYSWIFSMRGKVKILAPEWVLDDYKEMLIAGGGERS